jgi:hypothetical protein
VRRTLDDIAEDLRRRRSRSSCCRRAPTVRWSKRSSIPAGDSVQFSEYFHGDNGAGLGVAPDRLDRLVADLIRAPGNHHVDRRPAPAQPRREANDHPARTPVPARRDATAGTNFAVASDVATG